MSQINKDRIKAESVFLTEQVEFNIVGNIPTPVSSPASTKHSTELTVEEKDTVEEKEIELTTQV